MSARSCPGPKADLCWRKSRLAARILLRARAGNLTARDRRIGAQLKHDADVSNRLIDQAISSLQARHNTQHHA